MCSGYLRRSSNVRVDMTVQTRKLDGALRDDISKKRGARRYILTSGTLA